MEDITAFKGAYRWLSNFWPCKVEYEGITYNCVEAAYQAAKSLDVKVRQRVAELPSPYACKRYGRGIALRPDWDDVKVEIMRSLLQQKFTPGTALAERLIATGSRLLVEGNDWGDTFWGVCRKVGENHLGRLLMDIRRRL